MENSVKVIVLEKNRAGFVERQEQQMVVPNELDTQRSQCCGHEKLVATKSPSEEMQQSRLILYQRGNILMA